jgi:hypothetical protein
MTLQPGKDSILQWWLAVQPRRGKIKTLQRCDGENNNRIARIKDNYDRPMMTEQLVKNRHDRTGQSLWS